LLKYILINYGRLIHPSSDKLGLEQYFTFAYSLLLKEYYDKFTIEMRMFIHSNQLIFEAAQSLKEFSKANDKNVLALIPTGNHVLEIWKAPPIGMYKINWDVAIDSKNMRMGIGIIVRDCEW
jgi:hypothetical protein